MSKPQDKDKEDGRALLYYVLAMSHTPPVVVVWTEDRAHAEKIRADYEAMHGGEVIITTK